jgi:hypothetical protein
MHIYQDLKSAIIQADSKALIMANCNFPERQTVDREAMTHIIIWHIALVMGDIDAKQEKNNYGTPKARLEIEISMPKRMWNIKLADFFLTFVSFGTHTMYRKRLQLSRNKETGVVMLSDFWKCMQSLLVEW